MGHIPGSAVNVGQKAIAQINHLLLGIETPLSKTVSPEYNTNPNNFVVYRYADVLLKKAEALNEQGHPDPVSYTHLDVYKRQFLQLFPNFVEEFNALLTEPMQPKPGELLNTELRILSLIHI